MFDLALIGFDFGFELSLILKDEDDTSNGDDSIHLKMRMNYHVVNLKHFLLLRILIILVSTLLFEMYV